MFRGNAAARVGDRYFAPAIPVIERDGDASSRRRKAERVSDEIDQGPAEQPRMGVDFAVAAALDLHALFLRHRLVELANFLNRRAGIEIIAIE